MKRLLCGAAVVFFSSSAFAVTLDCYEDPRTNSTQCIDSNGVRVTKDGIRYSKLYSGGPKEVRDTNFTIHTNCTSGVTHLKDRQGVSFAGGRGNETNSLSSLREMLCAAKIKK